MELVNTHCHCVYSGHGPGTIAEYADAAAAAGLTTLAFTEHFPLSAAFDPDEYLSMRPQMVDAYLAEIDEARARHPQIEFVTGTEMDYLGALEDRQLTEEALAPFRFRLLSVHFIDGWAFDDPDQKARWKEPGAPDAIWRRYGELWCAAASDPAQPFDVMAHPDLAKKFAFYPYFELAPYFERMAEAMRAGERMIEVNTSGSYYACEEMFPAPTLLAAFCRAGVPCTVGTDAHTPANVARDIERAYALMYEAGYRVVTVPTASGDRREIPIE